MQHTNLMTWEQVRKHLKLICLPRYLELTFCNEPVNTDYREQRKFVGNVQWQFADINESLPELYTPGRQLFIFTLITYQFQIEHSIPFHEYKQ